MSSPNKSSPSNSLAPTDSIDYWRQLAYEQQGTIQALLQTIEQMKQQIQQQQQRIEQLEAEVKAHKKLKGKPKIRASRLNVPAEDTKQLQADKRAGSTKVSKKSSLEIKEEQIIEPDHIPAGAMFKGYREYDIQELQLESYTIRFRLAEYQLEDGSMIAGELPIAYRNGHYGPLLLGYIVYQHYQNRVTQPLLYEQLRDWGIEISTGQLHNILSEHKDSFHTEQQEVLRAGLETAEYVHTDDTGARHEGKNGYCTVIGNEWFTYFNSSESKSRRNFLEVLQGEYGV